MSIYDELMSAAKAATSGGSVGKNQQSAQFNELLTQASLPAQGNRKAKDYMPGGTNPPVSEADSPLYKGAKPGGEEKPKSAGIDLSPKQNVTGNVLYDQWREAMTGRLGKDFEARMNAAEAAADPKKLQDAYRTASDEYDKAKKAESAAKERMKNAPSDAVAEKYREGYESARAAREAAEAEFDRSKAQLESAGVELPDTSTWGRIKHLFAGTSLERLGSDVGAMRGLYEVGQKGRTAQYQQAYDELQPQIARAQTAYDEMRKLYGEAGATVEYNALKDLQQKSDAYKKVLDENIQQRATAATSEMANSLTETGGAKLEEAKQGLSPIGRVGVDAASAGLNMLYDAALGRFGGSTLSNAAMGLRSFGQTAQAAEASGADIDRQIGAGAAAAAKTVITNGLVDGLAGLYGKGAADDIIEMAVGKLGKTDAGRNALRALAKSAGEGVEELVDAKLDPLVSLIYDNGEALKQKYGSGWQGYKEAAADDLYSALIGFTLGAAGQGVSAARGDYARANADLTGGAKADANATAEAAPTQQTAAEVQSAVPTQQTAPAASAESRAPTQPTQYPQGTDTQEARPGMLERVRAAREQKKAAEEQATAEFFEAQAQYYEEHGWEAALPKELETKNASKWVKARTAAILEDNAARASREAKATPEAEEQAAKGKTGADYLAEAAGPSKGAEAPQTRTEAQGDNPAPAEAENVKQAGSGALNSASNLNNAETRAEGTIEERRAALDQRLARLMERIEAEGENPAAQDALTAEAEAIDAEDRAIKAAEEQSRRVKAGEVSKAFGSPENHIDNRSFSDAANKGTKAFQFDYPELHGYFVEAAQSLLADVQAAQDADYLQRYKKGGADYHGPINRLVDSGMTKPRIMQCLNDIISNNGAENYADAKRVEIVLNDMLSNGWLDMSRRSHEANAEYVVAKDGITGAVKADSWEKYRAAHALSLGTGLATEAQLRAEWEATQTKTQQPAQAQKNTASMQETESTAVNDDPAKHTPEENQIIKDYKAAVDPAVVQGIEQARSIQDNNYRNKYTITLSERVGDKVVSLVNDLIGLDISGYKNQIKGNAIAHIDKRHGANGKANSTMANIEDFGRINYVIENADDAKLLTRKDVDADTWKLSAEYRNADNSYAPLIRFEKRVDNTYYVVEAVPDSKANRLAVVSAYMESAKKENPSPKSSDAGKPAPNVTPEAGLEISGSSDTSIPTTAQNVKSENQENAGGTQGRARNGSEDYENSPKEKERGFSKNVRTDNAMEPKIRESFDTAPETYKQLANKDTLAKAEEIFARGLDEARGEVEQALGAAKSGSKLAPEMVPLARMVANELSKNGNVESARRILADVATELTAAGQLGQAGRILRDSDPNTALASIQKSIDAINAEFEKQHKRSKWRAELTEAETQEILSTDFTESGAYERIYEKVATRLGKEMPSSVLEKLTEIRRINMLLRPRTQIKNFVSNVPMVGLRKGAETLSIGIQSALTKTGRMKEADRTRGWASREQRQLARDYYEANKADINGQSNKWDLKSMLREKRTIFKGGAIEKAVSKMTGKEIDSFGEALRQVTYSCLEKGDARFVKSAFVDSLSQYCAAKGITTEAGITQEAIDFATANAMEATFKNANVIADIVNRAKRNSSPAVSAAIDVLIPFTTTPANILSLMGDYSPVGFAKLVSTDGPAARIDAFSKASVGTAMLALGFALRNAGIITGGEDDDKDKAALDKATGQGTYSFPLSIGGSVSYDWAQPVGSLLAFGAEIADAVKGQEGWDSALMNAIYTAGDSALNLSLFQNIISVLRGSGKPTQQIIDAIMEGGATQLVPGLAGDIAKIIDGTVRSTYTGGNVFNDIGAKVLSTTPGFSKKLPASVNVRGEENTRGGLAARTFNMLLNPTNYTGGKRNAVDEEIYRLYDATGGTSFFPSVSPYKIEYDNKLYTMNGKDRETFQKAHGQTYYELAKPLLDSEMYKALSDEQKADVLKSIRDYALDAAKRQFVDGRGGEYSNDSWDAISALSKAGISEYLPAAQALKDGKDGTGGSATYDAIDLLLGKYDDLSAPVRDELERKGLNVPGLRYSHALGMGAEDWYSAHEAVAEGEKTLGGTDAAKAISIYNSMEGKSDEEILNAMRAQLRPKSDDGGKQNATVRRAEAYMTTAKNNGAEGNLGEWLTLTAELKDADENDHVSKDDVEKAWANMGLGAKETYAGITLNDFYNITKSGTKSYANNPDYATQIDKIYAELYPDAPSVKAQLSGSVRTSEKADDGGKTSSGVPRNRDAAADWVMKHSRAAKRQIS